MSKKSKKNFPMEFPPRRDEVENSPIIDDVVTNETFNTRHHSGVQIDGYNSITEVVTSEVFDKESQTTP